MPRSVGNVSGFRRVVWAHYRAHGRHGLPWRKTRDPYKILVSELMLQQTQVDRVIPFYADFVKRFPTAKRLAAAPLSEVLRAWQGLGYNRRAKLLHKSAKEIAKHGMPKDAIALEALPGVGAYTARAVATFAYGEDTLPIETNIRTVVTEHFFPKKKKVSDAEIEKVLAKTLPRGEAREWYAALMDYGAYLKRSGVSHNARSPRHAKQKTFAGSKREARGAILRALAQGSAPRARLVNLLGAKRRAQLGSALAELISEGFVSERRGRFALAR